MTDPDNLIYPAWLFEETKVMETEDLIDGPCFKNLQDRKIHGVWTVNTFFFPTWITVWLSIWILEANAQRIWVAFSGQKNAH